MNTLIEEYSIPESLCDRILEEFDTLTPIHQKMMNERQYWYTASTMMDPHLMEEYKGYITTFVNNYKEKYEYCFIGHECVEISEPWNIQLYYPGEYYSVWHTENTGISPFNKRHLVFMTYLNTVDSGGETEFLYQNCKIKPVKGKTLIWPAYFTHTHRGSPSINEKKYITTGWLEFVDSNSFFDLSDEDFYKKFQENTII